MANLNANSIPTALPASTKLDLSCDHVTTMMFGEMQPVHYRHTIPGERISLNGIGKVRLMPLATSTYGRLRCNIHHFFVPFRTVFPQFDSFINDTVGVNYQGSSLVDDAPYFTCGDITDLFTTILFSTDLSSDLTFDPTTDPWDFKIAGNGGYRRFTTFGKYIYKILVSLGYEINWDKSDNTPICALAFLAYCRVYLDWYANQSYMDSQDVIEVRKLLSYNDPTTQLHVDSTSLAALTLFISRVTYDQDYFVGSWDNPFAPNSNQYSAITFTDIAAGANNNNKSIVSVSANDTTYQKAGVPTMLQGAQSSINIGTQYLHDALKVITDYSKRHQLAGATNINRALAQYGFGVEHMKIDRSYHIGDSSIDVEIGAVFSTADTAGAGNVSTLGDYAGSGKGYGKTDFDFKADEHGLIVSIASILPSGGYYQGMDRNNMHLKKTDFFVPEFDGLGVQLLTKREVYVSNSGDYGIPAGANSHVYDTGFGYTGRYGEYKRPRCWVSGDIRIPTRMRGGDAWHLMREFNDSSFTGGITGQVHSLGFTRFFDSDTYRRIFTYTSGDNDPFIVEFHWAVGAQSPCHGLFETYEFSTENNKKVSLKSNGGVLN